MGSVYIFSNPSLHGQLKVGFTLNSVGKRLGELNSSTSIPTKFVVEYYVELEDSETYKIEQATHAELQRAGHHHGKEFFKCTVVDCKNAIARVIAKHRVIVLHAEDAELTRQRVAWEKERIQAEQTRLNREAELERKLSEAEQAIKDRYQVMLDRISDPGRYLYWWLGFSTGFVFLIYFWDTAKGISGGGFVFACIAGAVVALFARSYEESDKQQSTGYLIKVRERDAAVASVRAKLTTSKPSQGVAKSSPNTNMAAKTTGTSAPAPPIGKTISRLPKTPEFSSRWIFDCATRILGEIETGTILGESSYLYEAVGFSLIQFRPGKSTWANFFEVHFLNGNHPFNANPVLGEDNITTALLQSMASGLISKPALNTTARRFTEASAKEKFAETEVLAEWLFDAKSGDLYEIHSTILFDKKYYQRKEKGFLVLMFKFAEYPTVYFLENDNPNGLNPRLADTAKTFANYHSRKKALITKDTAVERAQVQKKNEEPATFFELEKMLGTSIKHTITSEQTASVERYVRKKNSEEVTKITALFGESTAPKIDTPPAENTQQKVSYETETTAHISEEWVQWLDQNLTYLESYIEEFGADLIELVAKQSTKAQCQLFWLPRGTVYLVKLELSDQEADRETYGDDLINCVTDVAQKYFDDHQNHQLKQPLAPISYEVDTIDVENFGADFTDAVSRVVMFVFAQNILKGYRGTPQLDNTEINVKVTSDTTKQARVDQAKIPFDAGCKVTHIIQGETFGFGQVIARNGEYLVVEFPAVGRRLEMAVATAGRFLKESSET